MNPAPVKQRIHACIGSVAATGAVAALLAQRGELFLSSFSFFWLPALAAIVLVAALRATPSFILGLGGAICAILLLYSAWVRTIPARDSALAWAGYLLSMPGAAACALVALFWFKARPASGAAQALVAFVATAAGFAAGMGLLLNLQKI